MCSTSAVRMPVPRVPRRRERLQDIPVAGHKRVLLAAPRGYCAGVDRAVIAVEKALERYGAPVYVRKQIVHNIHVVTELEQQGAIFVDEVDEVPEGAHVVFSAHGVSPAVVNAASDRGLQAIDATCPLVTKVHREAVRFARDDFEILLIGHEGHEEVEGTAGEAPEHVTIVNSPDDADTVEVRDPDQGRVAVADHALGRRDHGDRAPPARAVPEAAGSAVATTSATPPRTARSRSRRSRRTPTS